MRNVLETKREKWSRLEELIARAAHLRLRGLSGEEVREFGRLYRRTAADLAISREEVQDKRVVNYLNHLVTRAHGTIYRSESSGFGGIATFFRYEFPACFRRSFRAILFSFVLFLFSGLFAGVVCWHDESFADRIVPGIRQKIAAHQNWTEEINTANPLMSTSIQTNNITVTFAAFAGGIFIGLGTIYLLIMNGLNVGMVIALCIHYRFWDPLIFMTAHGAIELTAIFIAGGAGLLLGKSMLMPGDLRRRDALVTYGLLGIKLIMGCIPMLLIAGTIEGFISPSHIPAGFKFAISVVSAVGLAVYFMKPDLRRSVEPGA
ncbi:MAG TPA: stage II sporulation protein M [Blastocatellia bacterium]|nr:stage II sporulation protein M [Blastocatellia bacterium]